MPGARNYFRYAGGETVEIGDFVSGEAFSGSKRAFKFTEWQVFYTWPESGRVSIISTREMMKGLRHSKDLMFVRRGALDPNDPVIRKKAEHIRKNCDSRYDPFPKKLG